VAINNDQQVAEVPSQNSTAPGTPRKGKKPKEAKPRKEKVADDSDTGSSSDDDISSRSNNSDSEDDEKYTEKQDAIEPEVSSNNEDDDDIWDDHGDLGKKDTLLDTEPTNHHEGEK
jgi:hypothetical protein